MSSQSILLSHPVLRFLFNVVGISIIVFSLWVIIIPYIPDAYAPMYQTAYTLMTHGFSYEEYDGFFLTCDQFTSKSDRWRWLFCCSLLLPYLGLGLVYFLNRRLVWMQWIGSMVLLWIGYYAGFLIRAIWLRMEVLTYIRLTESKPFDKYGYGLHYFRFEECGFAGMLLTGVIIAVIGWKRNSSKRKKSVCKDCRETLPSD